MSKEMMICPKALNGECPDKGSWIHCKPHLVDKTCKKRKHICGQSCIPYIPEQPKKPAEPTCPECGHPVSEHGEEGCMVIYEYSEGVPISGCDCEWKPADQPAEPQLEPKTVYCVGDGTCDKCMDGKCIIPNQPCCDQSYERPSEPQAEMMPLIKVDPHSYECPSDVEIGADRQRDADMAWHKEQVQQVRRAAVKELLDKIEEVGDLPHDWNENGHSRECRMCKLTAELGWNPAHIRAMAEGKE